MARKAPWSRDRDSLRLLLNSFECSQSCHLLGAGASWPLVPFGSELTRRVRARGLAMSSYPTVRLARDLVGIRMLQGENYTLDNWVTFSRTQPKPTFNRSIKSKSGDGEGVRSGGSAVDQLTILCEQYCDEQLLKFGRKVELHDAAPIMWRRHPELTGNGLTSCRPGNASVIEIGDLGFSV